MDDPKSSTEKGSEFPYRVVYADPSFLSEKGFGRVAHVPFIFDHFPRYHRHANQFLIDLALGEWSVGTRGEESAALPPPSKVTMKDYADWLVNYLEYCHKRGKDPFRADYAVEIVQAYQGEMLAGSWSRDNRPLAGSTANNRVAVACMYQLWAADKGLRGPFRIPKVRKTFATNNPKGSGAIATKTVMARRGRARESKRRLGLPEECVIAGWLGRLYGKCETQGLIAETILETAVRRAEVAAWRLDTLPENESDWSIVNKDRPKENQSVIVTLRYGTNGREYEGDHGDKIGPEAKILVPFPLAEKLHRYRKKVRPKALSQAIKQAKNAKEAEAIRRNSVHLFLEPETGIRYSGQQIYDFWTAPDVNCPKGWYPHLGRDFWACSVLWKHVTEQKQLIDRAIQKDVDPSVLKILALDLEGFIERTIRPQLRHLDRETTLLYLQWVSDRLHINLNLVESYMKLVGEEDLEESDE